VSTSLDFRFLVDSTPAASEFVTNAGFSPVLRPRDPTDAARWLGENWSANLPSLFNVDSVRDDTNPDVGKLWSTEGLKSFVVMDDIQDRDVPAGLTLNALPGEMRRSSYSGKRLRGAEYLIQDPAFAEYHEQERATPETARTGFAFFGGADGNDFTSVFLDVMEAGAFGVDWTLLIGAMHPNPAPALERISSGGLPIKVVRRVPTLAEEFWKADIAVINSGNTLAEAAAVGTPAICFSQLDIQADNAGYFAKRAGVVALGGAGAEFPHPLPPEYKTLETRSVAAASLADALSKLIPDFDARSTMRKRLMQLVDGRGAERVAEILRDYALAS
jgi:spore coat polysaccharide biosynthesis predicted glycosyltransferase SpsG